MKQIKRKKRYNFKRNDIPVIVVPEKKDRNKHLKIMTENVQI